MQDRLQSLDVFRGATVAAMILVNNPGDWANVYPPLLHAKWNGCTPTDLIFPFFLFIVGMSIHFAYRKRLHEGLTRSAFIKILKRTAIIFLLGIFLAWFTLPLGNMFSADRLASLRIPGVLQRISIVFFVCSILYFKTNWVTQIRVGATLLVAYYLLMTLVPVPGFGPANMEPGTNLAAWLDRLLLDGHLYAQSKTWDPEGVLSTVPAIVSGILGMLTGQLYSNTPDEGVRTSWVFFLGSVVTVAGLAWGQIFPINKSLWTSSFVLYVGGLSMLFFAAFYWLIDVQGVRTWSKPFLYYGVNAIFVYAAAGILSRVLGRIHVRDGAEDVSVWDFLYENVYGSWLPPKDASLLFALTLVIFFLVILRWMYKRNILIKV